MRQAHAGDSAVPNGSRPSGAWLEGPLVADESTELDSHMLPAGCKMAVAERCDRRRRAPLARFERLTLSLVWSISSTCEGTDGCCYREFPLSSYALEVDGRFKAEFATREGVRSGAKDLTKRSPKLQMRIYDAETKDREEVELPSA